MRTFNAHGVHGDAATARLDRYATFLDSRYRTDLARTGERDVQLGAHLRRMIHDGQFRDVVIAGMGCSAIVGDMVRAYCHAVDASVEVHVLNDYDARHYLSTASLESPHTLIVVSTYSGHSVEPVRFLQGLPKEAYPRTVVLTANEDFVRRALRDGMGAVRWTLTAPDREYPLFHAPQYFTIILRLFAELGLLEERLCPAFDDLPSLLGDAFGTEQAEAVRTIAERSYRANVVMVGSALWHEGLFRLAKMHFNEIAMVPATRNTVLEFGHSEIATLSDPERRHSVVLFDDVTDDSYVRERTAAIVDLLTAPSGANANVAVTLVPLRSRQLLVRYFVALEIVQRVVLDLGRRYATRSRDLISESTGNSWYHSGSIRAEEASQPARKVVPISTSVTVAPS